MPLNEAASLNVIGIPISKLVTLLTVIRFFVPVIVADACVTLLLIVQELPEPLVMYVPAGIVPPVKYIPTDIVPVTPPTVNVVPAILLLVIVATSCVVAVAVPVSIGLTGYASVKSTVVDPPVVVTVSSGASDNTA
jgi:hypothetical protein